MRNYGRRNHLAHALLLQAAESVIFFKQALTRMLRKDMIMRPVSIFRTVTALDEAENLKIRRQASVNCGPKNIELNLNCDE